VSHLAELTRQSVVVASSKQVAATVGGEIVIMGMTSGRYHGVTAVSARVWELVQTPTTISALVDRIVNEYDVTSARAEHDLLALVREMMQHDLIEVRPAPS
jgi:hypothetical protein